MGADRRVPVALDTYKANKGFVVHDPLLQGGSLWLLSYGSHASTVWWSNVKGSLEKLENLGVLRLPADAAPALQS